MSFINIRFSTENAAFKDNSYETSNILHDIIEKLEHGQTEILIRDSNGNKIGHAEVVNLDD